MKIEFDLNDLENPEFRLFLWKLLNQYDCVDLEKACEGLKEVNITLGLGEE